VLDRVVVQARPTQVLRDQGLEHVGDSAFGELREIVARGHRVATTKRSASLSVADTVGGEHGLPLVLQPVTGTRQPRLRATGPLPART
jgi:hypothetical protein